jgi:subtilisin family serine protease
VKRRLLVVVAAVGLTATTFLPVQAADGSDGQPAQDTSAHGKMAALARQRYVVIMDGDPLVTRFGQDGLDSRRAVTAGAALEAEQNTALKAVGKAPRDKTHSYTVALNGFATKLTDAQAEKMRHVKGVDRVLPDVLRHPTTDASPRFLGLSGPGGVWARTGYTGAGVVVGVIDTGIWPEHPSFADDGSYPPPAAPIQDLPGNLACNFGNTAANPLDKPFTCNNKLIGARQMLATYRAVVGQDPDEYDSARDDEGHGTHTASTAAGDADVPASIFGIDRGKVSGIAPRAQVVAYKALGNLGGFSSDLAAAIDQAVDDGVDVINYSVGGGASLTSPDDIAFLNAADAGVFVATSAGNDGPGDATIGGPASVPWITTVGASTQPRFFQGTVRLGNGRSYRGASITAGTGTLPLVDAANAGGDLCIPGTLDPAVVTGTMVLCRRGAVGRAEKSLAVQQAGGAAMVLYNNDNVDNLFTDNHYVPSVHLDNTPGLAVKAYIAQASAPTARIIGDQISTWESAPSMAVFSSRGPDPVAEDIIKPDLTAPGVQILAGASPTPDVGLGAAGELFQAIAGTSMSSPHVAGALALVKQAHPDWSAAMAKSALMTTTYQQVVDNDRKTRANPFAMGSGHLDLTDRRGDGSPFDPGLVYDAGFGDYLGFLCDAEPSAFNDPDATCADLAASGVPTQAENLNYPSIGVSSVPGAVTVKRTVTNVAPAGRGQRPRAERYRAVVKAPAGFAVTVSPRELRLLPGEQATFTVTLTNVSATIGEWRFGSLTWRGSGHEVFSPIAVKASLFDAPASVTGTGASGSVDIPVKFGFTGPYTAAAHGLVPATVTNDTVAQDPDQSFDPTDGFSHAVPITVTDAAHLRVAMPPDAVPNADVDLDLYLADPDGTIVAQSTNGGTDEQIDVPDPVNGTWTLYVHGWQTVTPTTTFTLYDWVIPTAAGGGNLAITAAPTSAVLGAVGTVTASWTDAPAAWNLGAVSHNRDTGRIGLTLVEVDNRP